MRPRPHIIHLLSLSLVGLLSLGACSRQFKPEPACGFQQNTELRRVSWKIDLPVRLYVHQSVPLSEHPEIEGDLKAAAEAWNRLLGKEVIRIEGFGVGGSSVPVRDGYSIIYWMSQWEPERFQEQARTTIYWTGSQIYEADVRINSNYKMGFGQGVSPQTVDFRSLMIHEFGHVLGLSHIHSEGSVMQVHLKEGLERRQIGEEDRNNIFCEY